MRLMPNIFRKKGMKFVITLNIKKSPDVVFRYLASPVKMVEWVKDFKSIRPIEGRRSQVGSTSKLTYKDAKSAYTIEEEVLTFNRNETFEVKLDHKELITTVKYQVAKSERGTILVVTYNVKFKNFINRIVAPFFKIPMKNQQTEDLKRLQQNIENL